MRAIVAAVAILLAAPAALAQDCGAIRSARAVLYEKPLTIDAVETPMSDFIAWFAASTGLDLQVAWTEDSGDIGVDRDTPLSFSAREQPALAVLEAALDRASQQSFLGEQLTWQFNAAGHVEIGPKSVLNRSKRVEIYDLSDLLIEVPNYTDAPQLDLNQALQTGQGGGGGPFTDAGDEEPERKSQQEKLEELITLIQTMVEPEQWQANGGDGALLRPYRATMIVVNAPEYIHRALGQGYCSVEF